MQATLLRREAEHCYEAGRGSSHVSQYLSEQRSAAESSEVQLRVQIIRQSHSDEVKLESQASKSGSGSGPERVTSIRHHPVIA